jgi:hypothetical protein
MAKDLRNNKSIQILKAAEQGGYGVPGVLAVIQLFLWPS